MTQVILSFTDVLKKFRAESFSERDKGTKFEVLMKKYLQVEPQYNGRFRHIWLWNEFPYRKDFGGGQDTGIDLVAQTTEGDYWAIQCKCYAAEHRIEKAGVDSFLATSCKSFVGDDGQTKQFVQRLWISTTNNWDTIAEETIKNQNPPVARISLSDLEHTSEYIDWHELVNGPQGHARKVQKTPREHQIKAIAAFHNHFQTADRGKLIMACGTGKTFTSLKIAETQTNHQGCVLFLVPSIALLGQTLREWSAQAQQPIYPICICSDSSVGQDEDESSIVDLALPASTNTASIIQQYTLAQQKHKGMIVVFSTYQSIEVIAKAQKELNRRQKDSCIFDLIICDEAHRTTGVLLKDKEKGGYDEKAFTKVHDDTYIRAKKRLYMTATPRLYTEATKQKAEQAEAILCSMDDENLYGPEVFKIGFGEAVSKNLLADYKVLILTVKEEQIPPALRKLIGQGQGNKEITTDDVNRLIGCINALSKRVLEQDKTFNDDTSIMKKAVAFCQKITDSKKITDMLNDHKDTYYNSLPQAEREKLVGVQSKHIDGSMGASRRDELLTWLKDCPEDTKECRILTNVRCLSEGVDVPSLDAVMFLSPKYSQVDVVQSVGRVMRIAPNKKYGYIIIPIMIPEDQKPEEALDDNKRYAVVWKVLNALRAHDDRFDAEIHKINLNHKKGGHINVVAVGDRPATGTGIGTQSETTTDFEQLHLQLDELHGLQNVIYAKMVQKVGNKRYWVQWATDVAQIAKRYMAKIKQLIATDGQPQTEFNKFWTGLKKNINPSITQDEVVQMLAQHLITQPVFEALFENYSFVSNNPVSRSLQKMVLLLSEQALEKDKETLNKFYDSVRERITGIDNADGKQKILIELYNSFFKNAFPDVVNKLGIVYTPIEVVDFINHSVAQVLKKEFNRNLSDENIHILDPFTGTGTFIVRLIQTGLIDQSALPRKYAKELHANEIVLLAYYLASINIENAFHDVMGTDTAYQPFNGICLTDTFQLGETPESADFFDDMLPQNAERVMEQKKLPVRVIIGNPPYSIGQKSANDNAQNQYYPKLDQRIADTYVKKSLNKNSLKKGLYDSYIKAFRWSSDRIDNEHGGIIAFITNGGWIDSNAMDGFRKCLETEFTSVYVFNLRGGIRGKSRDAALKEGQNVFDIMTGVAITILVKNPKAKTDKATIYYHDIGEYLNRKDKLEILKKFKGINSSQIEWKALKPNEHGDWLNQRSDLFSSFIPLNDKDNKEQNIFSIQSAGSITCRDAWVYNFSSDNMLLNMKKTIDFYNEQREKYQILKKDNTSLKVEDFIDTDPKKIKWVQNTREFLRKNIFISYTPNVVRDVSYRPFQKQKYYFSKEMNWSRCLQPKLFPNKDSKNICIAVAGAGGNFFDLMISNTIIDLAYMKTGNGGTVCLPLYYYEKIEGNMGTLFDRDTEHYVRRDAITDFILQQCQTRYQTNKITKEDIFYYVYGLLHSPDYRTQFAADLKKMLPRIPLVDIPHDFMKFAQAGRELAELHLNYELVPPWPDVQVIGAEKGNFRVQKLTFAKNGKEVDKTTLIYNTDIKITNIPLEAYHYVINGRSAIEWIMDRYQVCTDKASGITNDPNDWGAEHNNPRYILDLILSVITVSMTTNQIVNNLPKLDLK